ncbi:MAG TPA: bifunctional proline dehydrogenase/L-glutamate gamma-semialdehyde dehydrogenase PutA [Gammaproteobacteria bacterium]|nr:bifunctional proline dehydrogenase/L-glutamate gamma-semialdehyde dehydrogenase PutA [Gammaproteobacteria bacterium]
MSKVVREGWLYDDEHPPLAELDAAIAAHYLADEDAAVRTLLERATLEDERAARVQASARELVVAIRARQREASGVDALLGEYDLSSREGIVLMCLAEALLRIPDATTADRLIADKLGGADWHAHLGASDSLFVNASTWALLLTGRIVRPADVAENAGTFVARLVERLGEPIVRAALRQAMKILGSQFVMGETIESALERAERSPEYDYSFDMLGEAALTRADATRYLEAYRAAIAALGGAHDAGFSTSISVKLSALEPRYERAHARRALDSIAGGLLELARAARAAGVALTVDAEEADRLELSLAIFARVFGAAELEDYEGLGLAVQAYQKRAPHVLRWLAALARGAGRRIPVRLVKGAYWDSEIKRSQELGLDGYPVFTRKTSTDVSYLACARDLLLEHEHLMPQFATHNAHTVAWILEVGAGRPFEFQRLHGMGEELYGALLAQTGVDRRCRVYAPVGSHEHLLPYLVRRLLENGANTSFVNRLVHADSPAEAIVEDPVEVTRRLDTVTHPRIVLPRDLFAPRRRNSRGLNLADGRELGRLRAELAATEPGAWRAEPRIGGADRPGAPHASRNPAEQRSVVGTVGWADAAAARAALDAASAFQPEWGATPPVRRAECLRAAADLYERATAELVARCVAETGRTIADSLAEVREAVDLLRYYAAQCEELFASPQRLPGPTGEQNELRLVGRGVFVCISPWNFPVAIFTGQIAAALAAGNVAIAKPAEQGSLVGALAVRLLVEAGVPAGALHFLPGDGRTLGEALLADARVAGVVFTGSVETAQAINRTLARRDGPIATLIAETGGVNAMIVDSSALPEQVVRDAAQSAFNSAGQRCSALRLLCLQQDTADDVLRLLGGWMDELVIGDPALLATDVGPVIDADAHAQLLAYIRTRRVLHQCRLDDRHAHGLFVPPTVIELERVEDLEREVFGPVLHVVRYRAERAHEVVDSINATGYGLTLGVHTRIDAFATSIADRARVGNVYVNRNMIGAQVGVQPFGGMGLSGTGPKAGGPSYLPRFAIEQTVTTNTAAVGGNATLLSLAPGEGGRPSHNRSGNSDERGTN